MIQWIKWQIFKVCLRFNWNFTTTRKGRVWSTRRIPAPNNRIYFSGDSLDFTPTPKVTAPED